MVSLLTDNIYDLNLGVAFSLDRAQHRTIRCIEAHLWLTQEGLAEDIVLVPGECCKIRTAGRVVMQALTSTARFTISPETGGIARVIDVLRGYWMRLFSTQRPSLQSAHICRNKCA